MFAFEDSEDYVHAAIVVIPLKIALDLHGFWPQPPIFRPQSLVVELAYQSAVHRTGLKGAQPGRNGAQSQSSQQLSEAQAFETSFDKQSLHITSANLELQNTPGVQART